MMQLLLQNVLALVLFAGQAEIRSYMSKICAAFAVTFGPSSRLRYSLSKIQHQSVFGALVLGGGEAPSRGHSPPARAEHGGPVVALRRYCYDHQQLFLSDGVTGAQAGHTCVRGLCCVLCAVPRIAVLHCCRVQCDMCARCLLVVLVSVTVVLARQRLSHHYLHGDPLVTARCEARCWTLTTYRQQVIYIAMG